MSWSINVMGKGSDVAAKAERDLHQYKCSEPEEAMKEKALEIIQGHGAALPDKGLVVMGYGSMSTSYGQDGQTPVCTSMSIKLEINTVFFAEPSGGIIGARVG